MALDDQPGEIQMTELRNKTQALLERHHRDGERFAQMMKEGFAGRFGEEFWNTWREWIEPVYSSHPVLLDLGAGPGLFVKALAERYPGIRALGVEFAPYMLDAADPLPPGGELIREDLHDPHLPLTDASVDAALCSVVLHEMEQPVRLLMELKRCFKPGGRLLLLDWVRAPLEVYLRQQGKEAAAFDSATPAEELADIFVHFSEHNRFSREDLIYLLNRCGFAVIDSAVMREGRYARLVAERRS